MNVEQFMTEGFDPNIRVTNINLEDQTLTIDLMNAICRAVRKDKTVLVVYQVGLMRFMNALEGLNSHVQPPPAIISTDVRIAAKHSLDAVVFVSFESPNPSYKRREDAKVKLVQDVCPVIRINVKPPKCKPNFVYEDSIVPTANEERLASKYFNTLGAVAQLNTLFGSKHGSTIKDDMELASNIEDQMKLILSERNELRDAKLEGDILDALGDIITVVDGIPFKAGLEISNDVFNAVIRCGDYGPNAFTHKDFNKLVNVVMHNNVQLGLVPGVNCPGIKDYAFAIWQSERAKIEHDCLIRGYDPLKVYWEVHRSNMSKFCDTWEEASTTCAFYANKHGLFYSANNPTDSDFKVVEVYNRYVVKTAKEVMFGDEVVPTDKFLKGPNFFEPDFSDPSQFQR